MSIIQNNKIIKASQCTTIHSIQGFICNVEKRYKVHITLDDIAGITSVDPLLDKMLRPCNYHNNAFCNLVKKSNECFRKCIENKSKVSACCAKRESAFYGKCYMGSEEIVLPIKMNNRLLAILFAGPFYEDLEDSLKFCKNKAMEFCLDKDECADKFLQTAQQAGNNILELSYDLGLLSQYLKQLYISYLNNREHEDVEKIALLYQRNFIVNNTLKLIQQSFDKELSLKLLADYSYCNPSYLSHVFKEKMKINVIDYINQVRVDSAKHLLDISNLSVIEIGMQVGYNDSSYFSRIFKKITGYSPKSYRNRESI